jgi:uncharacterized phiE125 gp8 family phage protein
MPSILLTPPAEEPVTIDDAKAFLRVSHDDDDAVIASLVAGARSHIEAQTRRALVTQTWRLVRDGWPRDGRIAVAPAPLREIIAARVYDSDGATHAVDLASFVADTAAGTVSFARWSMPGPGRIAAGIEIDVEVGYGDAAEVPEPLRQAVRLLVAHWYENRSLIAVGHDVAVLPNAVAALIAPYRVLAL